MNDDAARDENTTNPSGDDSSGLNEIIVGVRSIYEGQLIDVELREVKLPDESFSKREVVKHPGAVAVVALTDDEQVLMVRQFRLAPGAVILEIPAGTLEPDESPEDCAVRELQEETGYKPATLKSLGGFYVAPGYTTEFIHLFLATDLSESALDGDRDEFILSEKIALSRALELIEQGEIVDGKTVIGLLRTARLLKR